MTSSSRLWHLAVIGAVVGYVTGIVVTTGPITVPIFLMYGLVKGAFLATEAAASLAVYGAKVLAFRSFGAMPLETFVKGLIAGSASDGRHIYRRSRWCCSSTPTPSA